MKNNTRHKKESFICDTLLPYCIQRIESAENTTDATTLQKQIATMKIFPYIGESQTLYGALKEPDINWYFLGEEKKEAIKSTDSYRVLDKSQMNPNLFKKFRQVFGVDGCSYICEFSDQVVIKDLVKQMSKECDYTEKWWNCAIDAFSLWNAENDPGNTYEIASKEIQSSYMLFDEEYCTSQYQKKLEHYQVILDIRKTVGYKQFIGSIPTDKRNDAIRFLKYLGIRTSFINRSDRGKPTLCTEIIQLFNRIGKAAFPVPPINTTYYERCELSAYIFFNILLKEDASFAKALANDKSTNGGITIPNVNNAYMPLCCDMFYLPEGYDLDELVENRLNMFIIKKEVYNREVLESVATPINCLSGIDNYNFGNVNVKPIAFYKWAWQFTNNDELLRGILNYFNSLGDIEINLQKFVLEIMDVVVKKELGIYLRYRINISGAAALQFNNVLNAIHRTERYDITCTVRDEIFTGTFDVKYRILQAIENQVSNSKARMIETEDFWNRIYFLHASKEEDDFYGRYAIVHYSCLKQDIILLCHEDDTNSYIEALCKYLSDVYDIHLSGVTEDWKSEYYKLMRGVNEFICDREKAIFSSEEEIMFNESDMADVKSMKDEYSIWKDLKKEKAAIMHNRITDIKLGNWRCFLNNKYHGRCQLCGDRTASGTQNAYYWTYRIKKESENNLANMNSNIFCLCPSCHGELSHGYLGKDLTQINKRALEYVEQLEDSQQEELDDLDAMESIISSFADTEEEYPGFHAPIICNVVVNGKERKMAFSWEHFMQIAFLLSGINDVENE